MLFHPAYLDVAERAGRIQKALRDGSLSERDTAFLAEAYAYRYKEGVLGLGHTGAAEPASEGEFEDPYTLSFVITRLQEDRDGDVVLPLGCHLGNFEKSPVWFFGHQEWAVPIGTARNKRHDRLYVWPQEDLIRAACRFDEEDPDAMFIHGKVKRGFLNATSMAFVPIEAYKRDAVHEKAVPHEGRSQRPLGWLFKAYDLTEISIVGVGSNAGAIRDALDQEKSFISPRLQKGLGAYAAQAKGCWNGWCPCLPCEKVGQVKNLKDSWKAGDKFEWFGKLYQVVRLDKQGRNLDAKEVHTDPLSGQDTLLGGKSFHERDMAMSRKKSSDAVVEKTTKTIANESALRSFFTSLPAELRDGLSVWTNEGPPRQVIVDLADWWGEDVKQAEANEWQDKIKTACVEWAGSEEQVEFHNEQGNPEGKGWERMELNNVARSSGRSVRKYIRHEGSQWVVHAESGKVLGKHDSKEAAERQLRAVEANKHKSYEEYCDFGSHAYEDFVTKHPEYDTPEFEQFVVRYNRADRDSGELQDISGPEVERLAGEYGRRKGFGQTPSAERVSNFAPGDTVFARTGLAWINPDTGKTERFAKPGERMTVVRVTNIGRMECRRANGDVATYSSAEVRRKSLAKEGSCGCNDCKAGKACGCGKRAKDFDPVLSGIKTNLLAELGVRGMGIDEIRSRTSRWPAAKVAEALRQLHADGQVKIRADHDSGKAIYYRSLSSGYREQPGAVKPWPKGRKGRKGGRKMDRAEKQLEESSGTAGGYTVPAGSGTQDPETPGWSQCTVCDGSGNCPDCDGSGEDEDGNDCEGCGGSGECPDCMGIGMVEKGSKRKGRRHMSEQRKQADDEEPEGRKPREEEEPKEEPVEQKEEPPEGRGTITDPAEAKASALTNAHLYSHLKAADNYLEEELPRMDNPGMQEHLQKLKDEHLPNALEHLRQGMEQHHPDHDIEGLAKGLEQQAGSGNMETGEENKVAAGEIPPETLDEEDEDLLPPEEEAPLPAEGEVPPGEGELPSEPGTEDEDEILERYRTPKGWKTKVVGRVRRTKDGRAYLVRTKGFAPGQWVLTDRGQSAQVIAVQGGYVVVETEPDGKQETLNAAKLKPHPYKKEARKDLQQAGTHDRGEEDEDERYKALTEAGEYLKELGEDAEVPKRHKAPLRHHAKRLGEVAKGLSNAGKVQRDGGPGSPLTDEGTAGNKGSMKEEGERQGKNPAKAVSKAVESRVSDLARRFGQLTGVRVDGE